MNTQVFQTMNQSFHIYLYSSLCCKTYTVVAAEEFITGKPQNKVVSKKFVLQKTSKPPSTSSFRL